MIQAAATAIAAICVFALAVAYRHVDTGEFLIGASLATAAIAATHLWTARRVT